MKKKIADILLSVLLFATGVCLLFWSDEVIKVVTILLASVIMLYGVRTIIKYIRFEPKSAVSLASGIISIVVGVILLFKQTIIADTISFIVGIFIIMSSIGNLITAVEQKGKNYTMGLGLSITGIVIGILCIIGKLLIPNIVLQFIGVLLIIFGVTNFINVLISPITRNKND